MSDSGSASSSGASSPLVSLQRSAEVPVPVPVTVPQPAEERPQTFDDDSNASKTADSGQFVQNSHDVYIGWRSPPPPPSPPPHQVAFDFVFIPSVYQDSYGRVGTGPTPQRTAERLITDQYAKRTVSDSRILHFMYASEDLLSGRKPRETIRSLALRLLRGVSDLRSRESTTRLIMFVADDLGGIILKDALVVAARNPASWADITEMSRVLVFGSCPHRSETALDMEDRLCSFLFANNEIGTTAINPLLPLIPGLAKAIMEVNGDFIASKTVLRSHIISIFGSASSYRQGISGKIADGYSGILDVAFERPVAGHQTGQIGPLRHLPGYLALQYTTFLMRSIRGVQFVLRFGLAKKVLEMEDALITLASPIYPLLRSRQPKTVAHQSPEFQTWLNYPGPQLLYVHGGKNIRLEAEQLFNILDTGTKTGNPATRNVILYFSFDPSDVRFSSIKNMATTFLAQIICHYPRIDGEARSIFNRLLQFRSWTEFDLILWLEYFSCSPELDEVTYVLNNFDQCNQESRQVFLDRFFCVAQGSERPWKIVVTSQVPGALLSELPHPSCVTLLNLTLSENKPPESLNVEDLTQDLCRLRPEIATRRIRALVQQQLSGIIELDPLVQSIICAQSLAQDRWPLETTIHDLFGSLGPVSGPDHVNQALASVISTVLRRVPDRETAGQLLTWILHAVRPLTIWELGVALTLEPYTIEGEHTDPVSALTPALAHLSLNIETWFAGLVTIHHNEVRIAHPRVRDVLLGRSGAVSSELSSYLWGHASDNIIQASHFRLASSCLSLLSRPIVQRHIEATWTGAEVASDTPKFSNEGHLVSYALQSWTHHLLLCSDGERSILRAKYLLSGLAPAWARGFWALSNPVTRQVTHPATLFPVLAGFGVADLVEPQDHQDATQGLLEAASNGRTQVVMDLLENDNFEFTEPILLDVLSSAAAYGNEATLLFLTDYISSRSKKPEGILWPPLLVSRAARLGLDHFTEKLLQLGCSSGNIDMHSPLWNAVDCRRVTTVRMLLRNGADVKPKQMGGRTVLDYSAMLGYADIAKTILEERGDIIEGVDESDLTPLYFACLYGKHHTVHELLSHGADPNMGINPDTDVWTPLVAASHSGFQKTVELLVKHSANPNMPGPRTLGTRPPARGTPLRHAAINGHVGVCRLLLDNGADPNHSTITPPLTHQVIERAYRNDGCVDVLRLILQKGADANAKDKRGTPVLTRAIIHLQEQLKILPGRIVPASWEAIWPLLLEHGADVNLADHAGKGPLFYAIEARQAPLVKALLEKGADVNELSKDGETPVCVAATSSEEILRMLLEKGADPDLGTNNKHQTALMRAAESDEDGNQLEILLEYSPNVDRQGDSPGRFKGWTALNYAVSRATNWYRPIQLLAEHGAGFRHKDQYGDTVLHDAASRISLRAILEFLPRFDVNETNDDGETALHNSLIPLDNLRRLINAGAKVDAQDSDGYTPLSLAAAHDKEQNVLYLLRNGADINLGSQTSGAALHLAARSSHLNMVKLLIEKGADVNRIVSGIPGTPLQAACLPWARNEEDHTEDIVRHLIESGAKVDGEGGLLGHPLNAAALISPPAVIDLLLEKGGLVHKGDFMERIPIHFAAFHGIEAFERVLSAGNTADVMARDALGRNALHWAAQAARTSVVERILSLFSDAPIESMVDAPDIDGWTPLCWAARGIKGWIDDFRAAGQEEQAVVMRLLLEHGADRDIAVRVEGQDQEWTPTMIARYSNAQQDIVELLEHGPDGRSGDDSSESDAENSEAADVASGEPEGEDSASAPKLMTKRWKFNYCDACLCLLYGFRYNCKTCIHEFDLCFKCYPHRARFHDLPDHEWEQLGPEYEEVKDDSDESDSESDSTSTSSSDSD
ncbi:ankyrin repeat-containing domain protein [Cercophora scortea]|uniref:Ankyrin repeat-containing domain protein n=1 Tax=Cercophora scortea TaxID=314031 RepID=A0AAE0M612_9PEZI|nr:ankyrin repeat-containing domain protein [Cercophora scortea]